MALLMLGVATKRERGELVLWLAILILVVAGVFVARGEGTVDPVPWQLHRRSVRSRHEAA